MDLRVPSGPKQAAQGDFDGTVLGFAAVLET
jgi:hypothetical protein